FRVSTSYYNSAHPPSVFLSLFFLLLPFSCFFSFTDPATPELYTLSLHDALPISGINVIDLLTPYAKGGKIGLFGGAGEQADLTADRKSTRLNSSHVSISYAVFCLKKKKHKKRSTRDNRIS